MYLDKAVLWKKGAAFLSLSEYDESRTESILKRFNKGCVDYHLLEDGDRILIALSGGKDSLELVRLLALSVPVSINLISKWRRLISSWITFLTRPTALICRISVQRMASSSISFIVRSMNPLDPRKTVASLCAWNRRKTLFEFAVSHGFNKIALGHHMDDILVTLLMNITFEGSHSTMLPSLPLKHYPLTIIRPLCLVHEADIRQVAEELHFTKQKALCPYEETTRRSDMQAVFQHLERLNLKARYSLWRSVFMV